MATFSQRAQASVDDGGDYPELWTYNSVLYYGNGMGKPVPYYDFACRWSLTFAWPEGSTVNSAYVTFTGKVQSGNLYHYDIRYIDQKNCGPLTSDP